MEHRAVGGGYNNNNNNRRRRRRFSRVPRRLLGRMEEEEDEDEGDFGMVGLFFFARMKQEQTMAMLIKTCAARVESYKEAYGCHEYQSKEKRKERARILQYIFSFGMASQSRYLKANN